MVQVNSMTKVLQYLSLKNWPVNYIIAYSEYAFREQKMTTSS